MASPIIAYDPSIATLRVTRSMMSSILSARIPEIVVAASRDDTVRSEILEDLATLKAEGLYQSILSYYFQTPGPGRCFNIHLECRDSDRVIIEKFVSL